MSIVYKLFYKQYGVRRISSLLRPRPIKLLGLSRNSLFHYYSDVPRHYAVDTDMGFLSLSTQRVMVDFTTEYVGETKGAFRKKPFVLRAHTKDFFREHKSYKYMAQHYKTQTNDRILLIQNYSYLNSVYKYVNNPMTPYYTWHNTYTTMMSTIGNMAKESSRYHYLYVDVPEEIPSLPILQLYMSKVNVQLLRIFRTQDAYIILELWKWLDEDNRNYSIFSNIDVDKYPLINIIFRSNGNEILVNLGYFNSFIRGQPNTTEFDNIQTVPSNIMKKLFLKFLLSLSATVDDAELTETVEEPVQETVNEPEEEEGPVIRNKFFGMPQSIKASTITSSIREDKIIEDTENTLDDISLDKELKTIDAEMNEHTRIYGAKLLHKGIKVDRNGDINIPDVVEEVPEPTLEELKIKYYIAKEPSADLTDLIDTLAQTGSIKPSDHKKYKKAMETYANAANVYSKETVKDFSVYTEENLQLTDDSSHLDLPDIVKDKSMGGSNAKALLNDYKSKLYHKDIVSSIYSLQKAGVIVKSHTVEVDTNVLGEYEHHRVELMPIDGVPSTVSFKIPVLQEDNTMIVNGNKTILRNQRVDKNFLQL